MRLKFPLGEERENVVDIKMDPAKDWIGRHFTLVFGLFFYTSWLYEVRALGGHVALFWGIKHVLTLGLMVLMLLSIQWRSVRFDAFALACSLWLLINVFVWAEYKSPFDRYFRALGQTVFVYLFITFLRQNPDKNPCMPKVLNKWFSPWLVFVVLTLLITFNVTGYLAEDVERGFGNSRVNFSIWLMQPVGLVLFSILMERNASKNALLGCLILITPAYVLQNMSGGRSGLLGTLLLVSVFAYRWGGIKALVTSSLWLYLVALTVAYFHPLITPENNLNIFRNLELTGYSTLNEVIAWLDKVSSYRVSIVITAFSTLSLKGLLLGMGLGNFVGWAPTYPELGIMEVHNVLLKILGEYGIFGFLSALFLVFWPFAYRPADGRQLLVLYLQFIYVVVAMVHPDLMMTAVNVSLVYFACYAYSLSSRSAVTTTAQVAAS